MHLRREIAVLFICIIVVLAQANMALSYSGDNDKKVEKSADNYFKQEHYASALRLYLNLEKRAPESVEYKYRIGICYIHEARDKQRAINYLEEVKELDPKSKDIEFYLGKAYHKSYNFNEALKHFNAVLVDGKPSDKIRKATMRHIEYCKNGKLLIQFPLDVKIKNMGKPINTSGSEYVPVISMDQSMMLYTYKGEKSIGGLRDEYGNADPKGAYSEDIYLSYKVGDSWIQPEKNKMFYATVFSKTVQEGINSAGHDASIALSVDGQKLFVYKDTEVGSGDIYISERDGVAWTYPIKLNININSDHWEGSASLSADEKALFFSSERPGGLGGKDIYVSVKREDGIWGEAINLGPNINTPEDDDAPFIHPDGKTLYFSSQGHGSMGGFDIFFSKREDTKGKWGKPQNIGYPINTTADDIYYVVTGDGSTGYFSSSRIGGFGQQDIYTVALKEADKPSPIVLLKGKITANDQFTDANITCTDESGKVLGPFSSNSATGEYIVSLPIGHEMVITYEATGFTSRSKKISTSNVEAFKEVVHDVNFYSQDYTPQLTMDGRLLYSENPTRPVGEVTVKVVNESGTFSRTVETNQKGEFRFINLPLNQHYVFIIEQKDPDLIPGSDPILSGTLKLSGEAQEGLIINELTTNAKGEFKFGKGIKPISIYKVLPAYIPNLDSLAIVDLELYNEIMKRFGSIKKDELIFRVQIAAMKNPDKFDTSIFADLGEVELIKINDDLTRFIIGKYQTLSEAESLREQIIQRDVGDAFTLIFHNGKRKYLKDIVADNVFQK